jgi:hypothetical protein
MEQGKSCGNEETKGKAQEWQTLSRPNTDVLQDGRLLRSSDETPVMGVERRGQQLSILPYRTTAKGGRIRPGRVLTEEPYDGRLSRTVP